MNINASNTTLISIVNVRPSKYFMIKINNGEETIKKKRMPLIHIIFNIEMAWFIRSLRFKSS
uniref:Putative ovule protein n=1 Tax=Solanum chacoense TaxID=4108 RepID=A0A0V0HLA6_SOLCH